MNKENYHSTDLFPISPHGVTDSPVVRLEGYCLMVLIRPNYIRKKSTSMMLIGP